MIGIFKRFKKVESKPEEVDSIKEKPNFKDIVDKCNRNQLNALAYEVIRKASESSENRDLLKRWQKKIISVTGKKEKISPKNGFGALAD